MQRICVLSAVNFMQNETARHVASSVNAPLFVSSVKTAKQIEFVKLRKNH